MIDRVLEPEVMDGPDEAAEYDSMDHSEVNRLFVDDLLRLLPSASHAMRVLDLGTGTAQIPIELCQRCSAAQVVAVDAAQSMIELAERNIAAASLSDRVEARLADAKEPLAEEAAFDVVMSNSIVHHLHDPGPAVRLAMESLSPDGVLLFRDLMRPTDEAMLDSLVAQYAAGCTPRQRQLFSDSLRAALTVEEFQTLVADAGGDPSGVRATSDRHWTWVERQAS